MSWRSTAAWTVGAAGTQQPQPASVDALDAPTHAGPDRPAKPGAGKLDAAACAIVAALDDELRAVLDAMPDESLVRCGGRDFWVGHLHGQPVVAVLSRIGKVAAATTATLLITEFGCSRVLFTGVAGGLQADVRVGDVVVADALLQHDMDASPLFPRWEVPLTGRARWPADPVWSALVRDAAQRALDAEGPAMRQALAGPGPHGARKPRLHTGLILSGDRFVSTQAESQALRTALPDALAVEMEGAAMAQVCADFGVPLAVVRTISDRADEHAALDFTHFVRDVASRYSARLVAEVMAELPRLTA